MLIWLTSRPVQAGKHKLQSTPIYSDSSLEASIRYAHRCQVVRQADKLNTARAGPVTGWGELAQPEKSWPCQGGDSGDAAKEGTVLAVEPVAPAKAHRAAQSAAKAAASCQVQDG
jgi:hypothetical protein